MDIDITDIIEYDLYQQEIKQFRIKIFNLIYESFNFIPYFICKHIADYVI